MMLMQRLAIDAFIESGDFDIADGQPFLHIGRGIPDFGTMVGSVDIKLRFKTYPNSTTPVTITRTVTSLQQINLICVAEEDKLMCVLNQMLWEITGVMVHYD